MPSDFDFTPESIGQPIIVFDTRPEPPAGYIADTWKRFTAHLAVAWTGKPPKPLQPHELRLVFITTDGNEGHRNYELRQHALVKEQFDSLATLPEVGRAMVMCYSGRNPYVNYNTALYDYKQPVRFDPDHKDPGLFPDYNGGKQAQQEEQSYEARVNQGSDVLRHINNVIDAEEKKSLLKAYEAEKEEV
ncbi:hypothetical protein M8818_004643 [Zalaria obscura]|uniref:Uncharacterized protein n=1 Tax=Zalaria obscura TaxID=2024903 RepID=A0ACC3SDJ6_9PEZI